MPAPILFLQNIHLNFGGTPLIEGADLSIHAGDRLCLVGRNGSGKSTLLKIAAGIVEADSGERFVQPGTTLRYLPQEPDLAGFENVEKYVAADLAPGDDPHRAKLLLESLGLKGDEDPKNMSGGETRRAAIARALAPEPDILLLDEPTNHLDLPVIEWLETELRELRSAIVTISHDRRFLETLSRSTVWMDRGRSRSLAKGFGAFEDWRDTIFEQEETERHKLSRKIVREEHWITHGVSGRRKRNMRRVRELGDLRQTKASERKVSSGVNLTLAEGESSGKLVARLFNVSKSFGAKQIIKDFSAIIQRGDRVGIVGPNGSGKTTMVNLVTGKVAPDSGKVKIGIGSEILVVDQKREMLDPDWTLKDALTDGTGDMVSIGEETKHVISYMKDFLFLPEQLRTPLRALSGGEKGRLMLARGLRTPSNFLILDEPTNDLDLETLDLLQEFVADFPGTVLIVSHDRDFLDRTCTSVIASESKGIWHEYAGGYSDMLRQRGGGKIPVASPKAKPASKSKPRQDKQTTPGSKLSFSQKHALETLPKEIERLEFEIGKLNKALEDPELYSKDPKKFNTWVKALADRETSLSAKEEEWLELEVLREEMGD